MNVGKLREALAGLPDGMEVILEFGAAGQKNAVFFEVCTHANGGMQYSTETMDISIRDGDGLDPQCWEVLGEPTFKIVA